MCDASDTRTCRFPSQLQTHLSFQFPPSLFFFSFLFFLAKPFPLTRVCPRLSPTHLFAPSLPNLSPTRTILRRQVVNTTMSDLNLESELFEKIVWTLIRRPQLNRLEFQRPVQVAKAETEKKGASVQVQLVQLVQMIGRDEHNNKIEFAVKHTPGGDCPEEGDELHVSWEIMTQGSHPVPYFSLQDIGTWSNWELVLRIGLKVLWKSVKTNMWHCKYLQSPPGTKTMDKRRSGALANYAWGAAIYAYLMRSTWPEVQSFVPRMGLAHVVEVRLNHFEQHVVCTPIPEPLAKLEGPRYQFRFTVARAKELRGTEGDVTQRLQNVDASWQSLDFEWARGKLSGADLEIAKTRTHCDHCWLQWNVCGQSPVTMLRCIF